MSEESRDNDLEVRVKGWLREAEWAIEDIPLDPQIAWGFKTYIDDSGITLGIYQFTKQPDMIMIQTDAPMTPAQVAQFNKMRKGRDEFLLDLHSLLLRHHAEFSSEPDKNKIVVMDRIYLDGLTKDSFWKRFIAVRAIALDVQIFFVRKLGGSPLPQNLPVN